MDKIETIRVFVKVASDGSFRKAAASLNISPAVASKYVNALEERLGVRLMNRTTRSMSLTEIGKVYLQRSLQILDDFEELDQSVQESASIVKGALCISVPRTLGEAMLTDGVVEFQNQYPDVSVQLDLNDRFVDIVEEGFDLAIRVGNLEDSALFARKFMSVPMVVCASKSYLQKKGQPKVPEELLDHECILDMNRRNHNKWSFLKDQKEYLVEVDGRLKMNSAFAVCQAVLQHGGIAYAPLFAVMNEVRRGNVEVILREFQTTPLPIHALYPHNRHLSAKVRCFVEFLVKRYGATDIWE